MTIELSIGITSNPRTWPIIDGAVKVEGVDLTPTVLHPSELFWRQLRFAEFDVAEMSMSSLMMAKSKGDERFVGIPVFTTRLFFHTPTLVALASAAPDGEVPGGRACPRPPGFRDAAVLPHHHAGAPRGEHRFPCRSQGQA